MNPTLPIIALGLAGGAFAATPVVANVQAPRCADQQVVVDLTGWARGQVDLADFTVSVDDAPLRTGPFSFTGPAFTVVVGTLEGSHVIRATATTKAGRTWSAGAVVACPGAPAPPTSPEGPTNPAPEPQPEAPPSKLPDLTPAPLEPNLRIITTTPARAGTPRRSTVTTAMVCRGPWNARPARGVGENRTRPPAGYFRVRKAENGRWYGFRDRERRTYVGKRLASRTVLLGGFCGPITPRVAW